MKQRVTVMFRSDDPNYDWESTVSKDPGYEFISSQVIENTENPRWPRWSFVIKYHRT